MRGAGMDWIALDGDGDGKGQEWGWQCSGSWLG